MEEKAPLCKSADWGYEKTKGWWGLAEASYGAASPLCAPGLPETFSWCWICWPPAQVCECWSGKVLKNVRGSRFSGGGCADI